MTKQDYIEEILSETLPYSITVTQLKEIAKDIVDGLDNWYEMSSDRIADSNYTENLRTELEQAKKAKEEELDKADRIYRQKLQEQRDNTRSAIGMLNREIEELKKRIP